MKTKQFFMAIVALLLVTNVMANEIPQMSIIPLENTKALVTVAQKSPAANEISITSDEGQVVYYKKTHKPIDGYKKIFDLSQLKNGTYEFKMKSGTVTLKRGLEVKNGKISVQSKSTEMEPHFSYSKDKVKVSYLNHGQKDLKLNVYDKKGLIHSTGIGNDFTIHRSVNLSNLESGIYQVLLTNSDQEYWFSVKK